MPAMNEMVTFIAGLGATKSRVRLAIGVPRKGPSRQIARYQPSSWGGNSSTEREANCRYGCVPGELVIWTNEQLAAATPGQRLLYSTYLKRQQWRRDPALWMRERLGESPWSKQIEILQSVQQNRHTAVPAAFDLGKSFIASRAAMHFVDTAEPGEKVYVITTAPSITQVKGILWREINHGHKKGGLVGKCFTLNWKRNGVEVAIGYKPSDYAVAGFQGFHADRVLVILDEAAGLVESLWEGADGIAANDDSRVLAIGNPESAGAKFGRVCEPGTKWNVIRISAFDSPNVTGEPVPDIVRRNLVGPTWIEEKRQEWGEDSPMWMSKVLALFVRDGKSVTVPFSWAILCSHREEEEAEDAEPVELGVDVGAGGDESVIRERRGPVAGRVWTSCHDDAMALVGEIVRAQAETGATSVKIDAIGVGWAIASRVEEVFEEMGIECAVHGVKVSQSSHEPQKYANLRSEIWWEVGRENCRTKGWDLTDVDEQTINELCEPKYRNDSSGRIRVELKEDTKKRLGRSPDHADALLLAFYVPPPEGLFFLGSV